MPALIQLAAAFTRRWVQFYTRGLPPDLGEARQAEVTSDVWEHQLDGQASEVSAPALALEIVTRALLGVPDDLGWRRDAIAGVRVATRDARRTTMALSTGSLRWMGLAAILGGIVWSVGSFIPDPGRGFEAVYVIGSMLLCAVGVLGFYLQRRPSASRLGATGLLTLLAGFTLSFVAVLVAELAGENHVLAGIFGILAWPLLIPIGFLLVGLGIPMRYRPVVLGVGAVLVLRSVTPVTSALKRAFPPVELLGSNLGVGILWAIGLIAIGAAVFSAARARPALG